eukprot:TRINITY_DN63233_c0_g1_i1.p1 TRINITY_DN63233_c0_g1~~TRINITY_DN63233_c0_g1_i1.p1  ORF type:complete len:781 (-),score=159.73 TRINITY_DN63233_c0_g1_i1:65-2407(-)
MGAQACSTCETSTASEKVRVNTPVSSSVSDETLKFLSKVPLFKRLPNDFHPSLAGCATRVNFDPGESVIKQGEDGDAFFVIVSGEAAVTVDGKNVAKLASRDYFGEVALLRDEPRTATITCSTKLATLRITRADFTALGLNEKLKFQQRKAVHAGRQKKVQAKPPSPKTAEERQFMLKALKANTAITSMTTLEEPQYLALVDAAVKETFYAGTWVINEGDANANYMYVVASGTFEVHITQKDEEGMSLKEAEEVSLHVGQVTAGNCFGELALLYTAPRAASVKASTNSEAWAIDRNTFKDVLVKAAHEATKSYVQFLHKVEVLNHLKDAEKHELAKAMTEVRFTKDEVIFAQGEEGNAFYILTDGQVSVIQDGKVQVTLSSPCFFGERALLSGEPRGASIKVNSDTAKALSVDRKSFDMLLGPLKELQECRKNGGDSSSPARLGMASSDVVGREFGKILRKDLRSIGLLGCGGFGAVDLVEHSETKDVYALKSISKGFVVQSNMERGVVNEKEVQLMCDSDFVVKLFETYMDSQKLYLLLELAIGGELYATYERKGLHGKETHALFYIAGVVLAFEHLHEKKILFRDLKPENLLLNDKGNIKLTDMGLAKVALGNTYTTCGTPDYFAPELIESKGHSYGVDWWTLGVLTFELMGGRTPFESPTPMLICQKVKKGINKVSFPPKCKGNIENLIKSLCDKEPANRLPMKKGGITNIKKHAWFKDKNFDWVGMAKLTLSPPYVPVVKSRTDLTNFCAREEDLPPRVPYKDDGSGWDADFATST